MQYLLRTLRCRLMRRWALECRSRVILGGGGLSSARVTNFRSSGAVAEKIILFLSLAADRT